jgi:GDPmannose 4,6-dehydratase
MWRILQQDKPDDYVLATGETHSVREFIELAFSKISRKIEWRGQGTEETGIDAGDGSTLVKVDSRYFRPTEVEILLGDATKARRVLGWKHTVTFDELVAEMLKADIDALAAHTGDRGEGYD